MILRLDKETRKLIKKISKKVAKKLGVDETTICIGTEEHNDGKGRAFVCFETEVDDVWADLSLPDFCRLEDILKEYMKNPKVEWSIRG